MSPSWRKRSTTGRSNCVSRTTRSVLFSNKMTS
jgi:hypothetical protein